MLDRFTNLLPYARVEKLRREYVYRLSVIIVWVFVVLVGATAVLLVPTYVFLVGSASAKETKLESAKSTLASADEVTINTRLAALSKDAKTLIALANNPSPSKIIGQILLIPRPGITLSGFVYTPATGKNPTTLVLSGTAVTRNALRDYQLTLQSAPTIHSADLPVSAYAHDTNIDFTITITLSP